MRLLKGSSKVNISKARLKKEFFSIVLMVAFGGLFYIGINSLQSFNGKRAFAKTGLEPLTLAQAMEKAQAQGKPILADFSAYWCGYCVKLDKEVFTDKAVKSVIDSSYIYARIDSESDEAAYFRKTYQAYGFPTLVILKPDGTLVKKLEVTFEPSAFLQQI